MTKKVAQNITRMRTADRTETLYIAQNPESPLVVLNHFFGDGSDVYKAMRDTGCPDCHLLVVGGLDWNADMAPWDCPPLDENDEPCRGGADDYLRILLDSILSDVLLRLNDSPRYIAIAGYSLAGLFAIYSLYKTDCFSRAASMSGSLWFPDFKEYAMANTFMRAPDRLYFSLGDKENQTRHPLLSKVRTNTEELNAYYKSLGISSEFKLNEGGHTKNAVRRTADGIAAILR